MKGIFAELAARGIVEQITPELARGAVGEAPLVVYAGFDPTAPSLHLGNLIPLLGLVRLQRAGHHPIAVLGAATAMVGDPSGKKSERALLSEDVIAANGARIQAELARYLDFDSKVNPARLVSNAEWLGRYTFIEFLRDIGKHFRVGTMLAKESVRRRIEDREQGMSFTELTYMLLQATDYLHLSRAHGCALQIGGNDQWGNITAGIELIRRVDGREVHGMTFPLLLTASGEKFGKSEGNALFLDPNLTSPYTIYQYFVRTDDRDVVRQLHYFTFLPVAEVEALGEATRARPEAREAQRVLAREVTAFIHGPDVAAQCIAASEALFGGDLAGLGADMLRSVFADVPSSELPAARLGSLSIVDALVESGLAKSRSDARRRVEAGGAYVNNRRVEATDAAIGASDLLAGGMVVLRAGKKSYHVVRFGP